MTSSLRKYGLIILNNTIRKSTILAWCIFGVEIRKSKRIIWDFTTLVLKKALNKHIHPYNRILEIGTGPYALLSIYIAKKYNASVSACDINPDYVLNSRKNVELNKASIIVFQSNIYSNVISKYDVIFFNAVYIPYQVGVRLGIDKLHDVKTDWCGGEFGIDTVKTYIKNATRFLNDNGKLILGFNFKYLKEDIVVKLCNEYQYNITHKYYMSFNPSVVYIIRKIC